MLSVPETCCQALGFILQRNVVYSSSTLVTTPKRGLGGVTKEETLLLTAAQLPLQESSPAKQCFQELLSSCAAAEIVRGSIVNPRFTLP